MRTFKLSLTILCLTLLAGAAIPASAEEWGNLKGQFIYDGKAPEAQKIDVTKEPACGAHNIKDESLIVGKDGGLKNVVVYLRTKGAKVNPALAAPADKVVLDNKNCRFEPHILPMLATQTLVIKNSDEFSHNSNIQEFGGNATNPILTGGAEATFKFGRAQNVPTEARCNIHPWMNAYIFARDNPYFAVSNDDGKFEIKDLPVGKLEFQVWQEKAGNFKDATISGWKTGKVEIEIKPGDNDFGVIKLDPKYFKK